MSTSIRRRVAEIVWLHTLDADDITCQGCNWRASTVRQKRWTSEQHADHVADLLAHAGLLVPPRPRATRIPSGDYQQKENDRA